MPTVPCSYRKGHEQVSKIQDTRTFGAMRALQFEQSNANNHRVIKNDKLYAEYFLGL